MVQTLIYLSNPAVKVENVALSLIIPHGRLVVDLEHVRSASWPAALTTSHLQDAVQVLGLVPLDQPIVLWQRGEVRPLALRAHAGQHHWHVQWVLCLKGVSSWVTCHPPGPLEAQHVGIVEHPGDLLPPSHLVPQQPLPRPAHLRGYDITLEVFCHYCP